MGLRVRPWMPVVTSARTGSTVGTGVPAREKLRTPAPARARPMRIRHPATIQRIPSASGTANGKGSRWSEARPSRRAARKRSGGRAMTPAVSVLLMATPENDNKGVILPIDNIGVNWKTATAKGDGGDGVGTTRDGGGTDRRPQGRGDRRADARSGPVLLQGTGPWPEDRAHHQLGGRRVRLHEKPRAAGSADRASDRPDAADQPPAHAAAGG